MEFLVKFKMFALTMLLFINGCAGYRKDNGVVYYEHWNESNGTISTVVEDVDYSTFIELDDVYAKDKNKVYIWASAIPGADPKTFKVLSENYSLDMSYVYYNGMKIIGADPRTFSLIDEYRYARDKFNVYESGKTISVCDVSSFMILEDDWEVDNKCAYSNAEILPGADVKSFKVINYWYAKDRNYVYSNKGRIIKGADPETFKANDGSCNVCAFDKNYCYEYGDRVDCNTQSKN